MTLIASIAVIVAAMLSPDRIQAKLNAIQAQLSERPDPPPPYVVYDRNTIIAGFRWQDDEGPNGLIVAYRVSEDGRLHRLATFKYGDSPHELLLEDATGDDRPEVLVTGTPGNRASPLEILSWDGKHFAELGETNSAGTMFIDIDADGIAEVVTRNCCLTNECGVVLVTPYVQKYGDDELVDVPSPDLEDVIQVTKSGNAPETFEKGITLRDEASKTCTLHIINGTPGARHRATSIDIVAWSFAEDKPDGPKRTIPVRLTSSDATVDQTVTLDSRCMRVAVTVSGPRGARVAILVMGARAQ